jgi:hypothetical protein
MRDPHFTHVVARMRMQNPCATMSLKLGGRNVQNIDLRWMLASDAPSSKVEITDFG